MKKLLSVLLIISTLFLSLGVQASFANWDSYDKYSSSNDYEMYKKDAEIENLKKKLKKAEARKEQLEKEKQEKDIKQRLKEAEIRNEQLEKEVKAKEEKSTPSLWSKIKSKFSFMFSSYVGLGAAAVSFGAIVLGICYTSMAGYKCSQDDKCHFFGGSEKGHGLFNQNVDFPKAFDWTTKIVKFLADHVFVGKVEKE